jgi:hypothetical protein
LEQQLNAAVRDGNRTALLQLIRDLEGRQALFVLSDENFVMETRAAKLLAALEPESTADRKAIRETRLSLLRQTDDEYVVRDLLDSILDNEVKESIDPSPAIRMADSLDAEIRTGLNDGILRHGVGIAGAKSKALTETAASMLRATDDPGRAAFFRELLARAHVSMDQPPPLPAPEVKRSVELTAGALPAIPPPHNLLNRPLTWLRAALAFSLVVALVWRFRTFA